MEKKCFIIMPIGDPDGYAKGHFNRVFQYIIGPACKAAGFQPVRADDPASNDTGLDMIKTIVDSDIAICDLSAKNTNGLYGFAIRQAIDLPVVLMRDMKTKTVFDMQEFGGVEYDESLRIDTVENEIEVLGNTLKRTFASKAANTLLNRLGISSAQLAQAQMSVDVATMEPAEEEKVKEKPLPVISPLPDYVSDPITSHEEIDKLKVGDSLFHMNYGKGEIRSIKKSGRDKIADVKFESESKLLVLVTSGVIRKIKA